METTIPRASTEQPVWIDLDTHQRIVSETRPEGRVHACPELRFRYDPQTYAVRVFEGKTEWERSANNWLREFARLQSKCPR